MRVHVAAPATVANLGPGFDSFALAVELRNELLADTDAPPSFTVQGEGEDELAVDGSNLVVRSMALLAERVGRDLPAFALVSRNAVPLGRGLGSSAAAVVSGLVLADRLLGADLGSAELLRMAIELEGHADNAAACLYGGLAVAYESSDGWRAATIAANRLTATPVILVPEAARMATAEARHAVPAEIPRADAVWNVSHAALTVLSLLEDPALLADAIEDRLHEPYRLLAMPETRSVFERLRAAAVPVCLAGSGPSLLAFETDGRTVPAPGPGWRVLRPALAMTGVRVVGR